MGILKLLLITSLIGAMAILLLSWRWFIHPVQDVPTHADAIVVFAGGNGERFQTAVRLADEGIASTLIVNIGAQPWPGQAEILKQCHRTDLSYHLICIVVEEDNTAGEARQFAQLAYGMGLKRLVAVTSDSHLKRASVLLGQCHNGTMARVGSREIAGNQSLFSRATIRKLIHEWGGLIVAWTIESFRNCPR